MKNVISEGDWKVETIQPQSSPDGQFRILKPITGVTALGIIVALCGDTIRGTDEEKKGIVKANSRLIAAAPDLIEACYEFLFSTQFESLSVYFDNEQKHAVKLMRLAVKKTML